MSKFWLGCRCAGGSTVLMVLALLLAACGVVSEPAGVTLRRGTLVDWLEEMGELVPRDPALVVATFNARLAWAIDDGAWVEEGDPVFILDDAEERTAVAERRAQLVQTRQELLLAELDRQLTEQEALVELGRAERELHMAQIRHRIATEPAEGGDALLRLDAALSPREEELDERRLSYERATEAALVAEESWLESQEQWQLLRDERLRQELRSEELAGPAGIDLDLEPARRDEVERARAELAEQRKALAKLAEREAEARRAVEQARLAHEEARAVREPLAAQLRSLEAELEEYYVRLEIEKRALPAVRLRLDREVAQLRLQAAERAVAAGEQAFAEGALAQTEIDRLRESAADERARIELLETRLAMAERGPSPAQLAELTADLDRARHDAEAARADLERRLAERDAELALVRARVAEMAAEVEVRARRFPSILENAIALAERERELLDPDDVAGREQLDLELAGLHADLARARERPPAVHLSPAAGLARVLSDGEGRPRAPGDQIWDADALVRIFPAGEMDVAVAINEVDAGRVTAGQRVEVRIEALGGPWRPGRVAHVSGVGVDLSEHQGGDFAGVTVFDARIALAGSDPALRQGMSALLRVELDRREEVLWLPRGAVAIADDGQMQVQVLEQGRPVPRSIAGERFGHDTVIVHAGLHEGERVAWLRGAAHD